MFNEDNCILPVSSLTNFKNIFDQVPLEGLKEAKPTDLIEICVRFLLLMKTVRYECYPLFINVSLYLQYNTKYFQYDLVKHSIAVYHIVE